MFTSHCYRPAVGHTHPPIHWDLFIPRIKQPGRQADHPPQTIASVKKTWNYTSTLSCVFMAQCLVKHKDSSTIHICGIVMRVPGYTSMGPGFESRRYQISREIMGLEQGPLRRVRISEELFERKGSGSVLENRN
jgi:hypothetical protein